MMSTLRGLYRSTIMTDAFKTDNVRFLKIESDICQCVGLYL